MMFGHVYSHLDSILRNLIFHDSKLEPIAPGGQRRTHLPRRRALRGEVQRRGAPFPARGDGELRALVLHEGAKLVQAVRLHLRYRVQWSEQNRQNPHA